MEGKKLVEVNSRALENDFIGINLLINGSHPNYIRPWDKDIEGVFDPAKNKAFRLGECIRWILTDSNGNPIGRIAAFSNRQYKNKGDKFKVGGVGFFDCINDQVAANILFDKAKNWLLEKGMEAMDGPINFGEREKWWGCLVEGFHEPLYGMNFNPPYYKELFENYGFNNFFNQHCFGINVHDPLSEKFYEQHEKISQNPDIKARFMEKGNFQKFAEDFTHVYNKAWAGHGGLKSVKKEQIYKSFLMLKPVWDREINWFVYHKEEPIAFYINIPDINQYLKYLDGKFGLIEKLKFLWMRFRKKSNRFVGLVFGVIPEWQGQGIDRYMIVEASRSLIEKGNYDYTELQWIGDFNPKMLNIAKNLGAKPTRKLTTYRYIFNRDLPFERHPALN